MKDSLKKVSGFLADKGFYIVLVLCIAVIGVSGYQIYRVTNKPPQAVVGDAQIVAPAETPTPTPSATPSIKAAAPKATPTPTPAPEPEPAAAEPSPSPKPVASAYVWPVKGKIIADYSLEVQAYDETMGDWRTHEGIDIACDKGTEVRAAGNGTVIAVYKDDLMGTTVVIDHGNGVSSLYANLAATPNVGEGDEVNAGDTIGSVGKTAIAESKKADHLHLEMTKNGEAIDPENYLPKES